MFFLHLIKKSPKGVSVYLRTLKAAFNRAVEWEYISENHLSKIKLPKHQREEQKFLSLKELKCILDAVNNNTIKALIKVAFFTGLRRSEVLNLRVKHIDFKEGFLQVGDETLITKSRKIRIIPMCREVEKILKTICRNKNPEDLIFGKTKKYPYSPDHITRMFKRAVREKQITDQLHFHSLRHSYITYLANNKEISLPAVQMLAGHSSVMTTMGYVHVDRNELRKSVDIMNKLI